MRNLGVSRTHAQNKGPERPVSRRPRAPKPLNELSVAELMKVAKRGGIMAESAALSTLGSRATEIQDPEILEFITKRCPDRNGRMAALTMVAEDKNALGRIIRESVYQDVRNAAFDALHDKENGFSESMPLTDTVERMVGERHKRAARTGS